MNHYIISKEGSVYSTKLGRFLKPQLINSGYLRYQLNGKTKLAHRLVAEEYIENPCHHKYVNHRNGDKLDNRVSNLEWCNHSVNMLHAYRTLKVNHVSKLTKSQVEDILAQKGKRTLRYLAKQYSVSTATICRIWNRKIWIDL